MDRNPNLIQLPRQRKPAVAVGAPGSVHDIFAA